MPLKLFSPSKRYFHFSSFPSPVLFSFLQVNRAPISRASSWAGEKKPSKRSNTPLFTTNPLRWPNQQQSNSIERNPSAGLLSHPPSTSQSPAPPHSDAVPPQVLQLEPSSVTSQPTIDSARAAALQAVFVALAAPQQSQRLLSMLSSIDSSESASTTPNPDLVQMLGMMITSAASAASTTTSTAACSPLPVVPSSVGHTDPSTPFAFLSTPTPSAIAGAPTSACVSLLPSVASAPTPPTTDQTNEDDEVVVLDKENVNPIAFRRKPRGKEDLKQNSSLLAINHRLCNCSEPTLCACLPPPVKVDPDPVVDSSGPNTRKRTLSDFMDQRDRDRDASRKRVASSTRRPATEGFGSALSSRGAVTNYALNSEPCSIPSRASDYTRHNIPPFRGASASAPATSPPRRGASVVRKSARRHPYVVPDWAKTTTATLPRAADGSFLVGESTPLEGSTRTHPVKKGKEKQKSAGPKVRKPRPTTYKDPS